MTEFQSGLVERGEPEGDADQGVDVVASQQGQSCQLVLSDQQVYNIIYMYIENHS